ncbi:hypothetical protein AMK68_03685 [candidate division KD3-62 bacterium DG_56]|uniref:Uncharacterized protein n=1 Tax=candidate division KD3-62 bacterium DG_56 TaxID=1704032 RepID=A0A0S7XM75_9BACT|nr:MAG: hypothetical protein AMK68_03685 [candidate division KD3-62 bacterium DG_56]
MCDHKNSPTARHLHEIVAYDFDASRPGERVDDWAIVPGLDCEGMPPSILSGRSGKPEPPQTVEIVDGALHVRDVRVFNGLPCGDQRVELEFSAESGPVVVYLRCEAEGEIVLRFDLRRHRLFPSVSARSQYYGDYEWPEESHSVHALGLASCQLETGRRYRLRCDLVGPRVEVALDQEALIAFEAPGRRLGHFGFYGRDARLYRLRQIELLSEEAAAARQERRHETTRFAAGLDERHPRSVADNNQMTSDDNTIEVSIMCSGHRVRFNRSSGQIISLVSTAAGSEEEILGAPFPRVWLRENGPPLDLTPTAPARISHSDQGLTIEQITSYHGADLTIRTTIEFSASTLWRWTIEVEGTEHQSLVVELLPSPRHSHHSRLIPHADQQPDDESELIVVDSVISETAEPFLDRHNGASGVAIYLESPDVTRLGEVDAVDGRWMQITSDRMPLTFWTLLLPHQQFNREGFKRRIVQFVWHPTGDTHETCGPHESYYPSDEYIDEWAAHGATTVVLHHGWSADLPGVRGEPVVNEAEMSRVIESCRRHGLELVFYFTPVAAIQNPVIAYLDLGRPRHWWNGALMIRNWSRICYAGAYRDWFPEYVHRLCQRYAIAGIYVDGGWDAGVCDRDHQEFGAEAEPHAAVGDMYRCVWRLSEVLGQRGAAFGCQGYTNGGGPLRCLFQTSHLIGESADSYTPQDYLHHQNAVINGQTFKLWGRNAEARAMQNIGAAAVSLADIQMVPGNRYFGCDPVTEDEWDHVGTYWQLLGMIDFDRLVQAHPWWTQQLVDGGCYASFYEDADRVLVFLTSRAANADDVTVTLRPEALRSSEWTTLRMLHPEERELGAWPPSALAIRLPGQAQGYVALTAERS